MSGKKEGSSSTTTKEQEEEKAKIEAMFIKALEAAYNGEEEKSKGKRKLSD